MGIHGFLGLVIEFFTQKLFIDTIQTLFREFKFLIVTLNCYKLKLKIVIN